MPVAAQDTRPAQINYRERPRYPYDPQRLKARPTIDGAISENEWTPLYTISDGPVKGTLYVNWDDEFFYIAARIDTPGWLVFDIDANADGWLRGNDNLEITVGPLAEGMAGPLSVRVLDAAANKDAPVWNEKVIDPKSLQYAAKPAGAGQVIEIAIPRGVAGLTPRRGAGISVRGDFLPASSQPVPTAPYEPHLLIDIQLVEERSVAAPGITPRLSLEDKRLVPGQTLKATFELSNQVDSARAVRSVTWQGEAGAADLLKLVREVNTPPIPPLKTLKLHYQSPLPETAIPGFYQMTATALLDNGASVTSTIAFSVVDAVILQMTSATDSITVLGPTEVKFDIEIANYVNSGISGDLEITVPGGWVVKGRARKAFTVDREDRAVRTNYVVTIPSGTAAGSYPVSVTARWRNRSWTVRRTLQVTRPPEPKSP
jgi:hypothetical protein